MRLSHTQILLVLSNIVYSYCKNAVQNALNVHNPRPVDTLYFLFLDYVTFHCHLLEPFHWPLSSSSLEFLHYFIHLTFFPPHHLSS